MGISISCHASLVTCHFWCEVIELWNKNKLILNEEGAQRDQTKSNQYYLA